MATTTKAKSAQSALGHLAARMKMTKMPAPPKPKKGETPMFESYPPTLNLNSDQAAFVKGWRVGDVVTVVVKGKVDSVREESEAGGKTCTYTSLRITEAAGGAGK